MHPLTVSEAPGTASRGLAYSQLAAWLLWLLLGHRAASSGGSGGPSPEQQGGRDGGSTGWDELGVEGAWRQYVLQLLPPPSAPPRTSSSSAGSTETVLKDGNDDGLASRNADLASSNAPALLLAFSPREAAQWLQVPCLVVSG